MNVIEGDGGPKESEWGGSLMRFNDIKLYERKKSHSRRVTDKFSLLSPPRHPFTFEAMIIITDIMPRWAQYLCGNSMIYNKAMEAIRVFPVALRGMSSPY